MSEQPTSEQKLTTWVVRVDDRETLSVEATTWECSGNVLRFYVGENTVAWFLKWDYFYEQ